MDAILKFQGLLEKLFQFDASDLDFGIYRILNFKRDQIGKFIREDLKDTVEKAFAKYKNERLDNIGLQLEEAKQKVMQTLGTAAILATGELKDDFKGTPVGRDYLAIKAQKEEAETIDEIKLQVFNDLYNFFARYYEEGDFVPHYRYSIKNHKYAIPYNGEEVKLYWANCDQYYTKTGILFRDYAFFTDAGKTFKVILRTVAAKEELGSNKATKARFFVPDDDPPSEMKDGKNLIIRLQYRELSGSEVKKYGVEGGSNTSRQEKINSKIHESVIKELKEPTLKTFLGGTYKNDKPLLLYQLGRFSAKNTKDYFIHKNLKRFLSEQLDYFIKAEVISLETLEKERFFDKHITRAKVVREIGEKIIDFLSQIEDFQKKLWEKKKFVLKTEYVVTTDLVPEELHPEILKNKTQIKEWKELGFEGAKSKAELKDKKLPIDTKHFSEEFKERLLEQLTESANLDDLLNGLLIKSENWQALNLIVEKYKEKVKCIYIDPPYNTNASEILYKNNYKHSSWLSLMHDRMLLGKYFLCSSGLQCTTVDDMELHRLRENINSVFGDENIVGVVTIKNNPSGRSTVKGFSIAHEYAIFSSSTTVTGIGMIPRTEHQISQYKEKDTFGYFQWRNFMRSGGANDFKAARPKLHYPVVARCGGIAIPKMQWSKQTMRWELLEKLDLDDEIILPVSNGIEYTWRLGVESLTKRIDEVRLRTLSGGKKIVEIKFRIDEEGVLPKTVWDDKQVNATAYGTTVLRNLMGVSQAFSFPKSVYAVQRCISVCGTDENDWVLDYFGGSGTTAHAIINLNRQDSGNRKYILVEMGDWFEAVLLPRIKKVVYSDDWKDGKPQNSNGISHFLKYQYLEQYEDAIDNLELVPKKTAQGLFGDDYLLKYFLDFETKDNPNLLNMDHLKKPFSYKLKVNPEEAGEPQEVVVDIPETFHYLLGLKVNKVKVRKNKGKKYHFTLGEKESRTIAIVWREYDDEWTQADFKKDREFIIEDLACWSPQIVYVSGQSVLTPALGDHVVEIRSIEPEFKALMVNSL
jgi:adenine-specific DNA-methyltransferase